MSKLLIKLRSNLLLVLLMVASLPLAAQQKEYEKEIKMTSNRSQFEENKGRYALEGNIRISQGSLLITADKGHVLLANADNGNVTGKVGSFDVAVLTGSPAKFSRQQEDGTILKASANKIEYQSDNKIIRFVGNAKLNQSDSEVSAESIEYDMVNEVWKVEGSEAENRQVTTILKPSEWKKNESKDPEKQNQGEQP